MRDLMGSLGRYSERAFEVSFWGVLLKKVLGERGEDCFRVRRFLLLRVEL
jgi:hypothetical protein